VPVTRKREQTRARIMDAAYILFRQRGYTRVNVDEIAAAARITKRTLYSHFVSKDALLEAVLETQHALAFAAFQTFGRQLSGGPEKIVRSFFQELMQWSMKPRFAGSGFTRLAMELADLPGHPARRIASRHKKLLEALLLDVLHEAGLSDARKRARQIWILSEGVIALSVIHGDKSYCAAAEEAALALISHAR
jgi:AcrR family transcriptional regulator